MNEGSLYLFLQELGVELTSIRVRNGWMNLPCLLAKWTHEDGRDEHPSMGIAISETGKSVYYCFGCSKKAHRLEHLLHNIFVGSGDYPNAAASILLLHENDDDEKEIKIPDGWEREKKEVKPIPFAVLRRYPILQLSDTKTARDVKKYLNRKRKIPTWAQNFYQLRYSEKDRAIASPMTDPDGRIYVIRFRSIDKKEFWTLNSAGALLPYDELATPHDVGVWFGMSRVDWTQPVTLVEGTIDALRLTTLGISNVIASETTSVTDAQIDALCANVLVLGYDADKAGLRAHKRIIERIGGKAAVLEINWSQPPNFYKDPGDLPDREALDDILKSVRMEFR
jgi:hypothetical protein